MIAPPRPPAPSFRLVRYFIVASLAVFLPVAAALLYFDRQEDDLFKQAQQQQDTFFAQMQDRFVQRHDAAAPAYLLRVYEAGNVNLARLFANTLWEKDLVPFVAKAQRIPVDRCRAIAAGGKTLPPGEKQACYAGIGKQIMALPEFRALDAKVFETVKKSTVLKIKVYDLRGITVYSSEHNQIGEDNLGNAGWQSAIAGKPASQLTFRDKFSAFEGEVANRDLISSYLPVVAHGSEKTVAVFEVYSDVTQFLAQIKSTSSEIRALSAANRAQMERAAAANQDKVDAAGNLMFAIILGMLALLYCALLLIVRNGQRIIDQQDTERKQAGLALSRQKDLYDALSQSNKAIVHLVDRDELFATVCRIAVEHGRFRFAWIGLIDENDQRLKPVARYGEDAGYINALDVSGGGASDSRRGLTGRTLLSGAYVVSNEFLNDPAMAPWHEAARRAGVRASAKFPIRQGGVVIGAINLYAGEAGFFTVELVATIDEIANDLSFALDNYARDAARKQAERALREGEERYRQLFVANPHPMWVFDIETLGFLAVNDAAVAHYGWSREEFLAMTIADIRPAEDIPTLHGYLAADKEKNFTTVDSSRHRKKDGTLIDVDISTHIIGFSGRRARVVTAIDITERKRAEQSLAENRALLQAIVNSTPDAIYVKDPRGRYLLFNTAAEGFTGKSTSDVLGKDDSFLFPPAEAETIMARDRKVLESGAVATYEELATDANGRVLTFLATKGPISGASGKVVGLFGISRDITERKVMEEKLRDSVAFRELLLQAMPLPVFHKDALGRYTGCNRAFTEFIGKTENDIVGKTVYEVSPQSFAQNYRDKDLELLNDPAGMQVYESRVMHADGTAHDVIFHKARIVDGVGRPTGIVGAIADISESKRAQQALQESEARFRGLVEQSIAGIYIIQDGTFAYVNPRFAEIRGYSSADEMIGLDPLPMIAEKDRGHVAENIRRLLAGEMPSIDYSFVVLRKNDSSVEVGVHSALATYRGRPAIIGLMQDISEKKRAEEQIKHYIAQLENAFMQSVEVATTLSEMRDPYTAGHERRVAEIAVAISAELGFDARRQEGLRVAGYLHDVGKITVPAEILAKPTKLTPIEYQLIQGHAQASYDVLKNVEFPWPVAEIALQHHERIDGSGYPQGLKGDAILLEARILAVADTVEAMSSHRPYRPGLGIEKALAEIERGRGTAYDASVADACLRLFREKGYAIPA